MQRELSSAAVRAGYGVHQHKSHVGILWGWTSPIDRGSHIRERNDAVVEAEAAFQREVIRSKFVVSVLES